jgi:D-arabinose 5-phosphate isomerase GutQ
LAAAIPANRLAHGGARIYVQDDIVPIPHTINGGGIIAASASGRTASVLTILRAARNQTRDVQIVGVAAADAAEFRNCCDIFIGIEPPTSPNPLKTLADSEEYVISELLDAMVAAAGKMGGFVDTLWRLGHENLGQTGPYDYQIPSS